LIVVVSIAACGKSGPPLPPLVKLPSAPGNMVAERRGSHVDVQFTIPSANTDGSRPANVQRVDVYAITGAASIPDDQLLKRGTKIASLRVKAPRDPNQTVDPDEPGAEIEPPEGEGLDQGATAHVADEIDRAAMTPYDAALDASRRRSPPDMEAESRPLVGPALAFASRSYAAVGISTRGRKGPLSKRSAISLAPPPAAPAAPTITYDEKAITVTWTPVTVPGIVHGSADDHVLPSTPIGVAVPKIAYNVYSVEVRPFDRLKADATELQQNPTATETGREADTAAEAKLTKSPVEKTTYEDARIAWGEQRCYAVRAIESLNDLTVESDASAPACVTLTDTFPPAAPKNLQAVPSEGVISLIWDANTEQDLAGYLVFRGKSADALLAITESTVAEPTFKDTAPSGATFTYAVKAVDKAGNASALSNRVQETAR
jgi:hypothetical protein